MLQKYHGDNLLH